MINDINILLNKLLQIYSNFKRGTNRKYRYIFLLTKRRQVVTLKLKVENFLEVHLSELTDNQFIYYSKVVRGTALDINQIID